MNHTPQCFMHHMGVYMLETRFAQSVKSKLEANPNVFLSEFDPKAAYQEMLSMEPIADRRDLYGITAQGVAIIPVIGVMTKGSNKFGTSTNQARRALSQATNDPSVKAIMLHFDTPGGSFAGSDEFAADVAKAATIKPLAAHADDLVASAGMYVASQAPRLTLNAAGEAGSIGTYTVVYDSSGAAEMQGVKVHLITTGANKGVGADGVPINEPQLTRIQSLVNQAQSFFSAAIAKGRNLSKSQVDSLVSDGGTWFAKEAKQLGLIDAVESYDVALEKLAARIRPTNRNSRARQIQILELE